MKLQPRRMASKRGQGGDSTSPPTRCRGRKLLSLVRNGVVIVCLIFTVYHQSHTLKCLTLTDGIFNYDCSNLPTTTSQYTDNDQPSVLKVKTNAAYQTNETIATTLMGLVNNFPSLLLQFANGTQDDNSANQNDKSSTTMAADSSWRGYRANRSIVFIHVGKAGGMTFRRSTALNCHVDITQRDENCVDRQYPLPLEEQEAFHQNFTNSTGIPVAVLSPPQQQKNHSHVLSRQTQHYMHIWGYRPYAMNVSTSFLFNLRNPVERIISTYKYAHIENCIPSTKRFSPWSCTLLTVNGGRYIRSPRIAVIYKQCFTNPAMEYFAQATMSPYYDDNSTIIAPNLTNQTTTNSFVANSNMTTVNIWDCRQIARRLVQGVYEPGTANPHMYYNYQYYIEKSMDLFPGKEIFAIRTEHEWQDIINLDQAIGTNTKKTRFTMENHQHQTWGSEFYAPSPLTQQAIRKLCCVLHHEIELYFFLLDQALNLNDHETTLSKDKVLEQCEIISVGESSASSSLMTAESKSSAFQDWKRTCQEHLERDEKEIDRQQALAKKR